MNAHSANMISKLPTPESRPGSHIVIYDGNCEFCTAQVRRLHRWDSGKRLSFLSLHDPQVNSRFPDLTHQQLMDEMLVVTPEGKRYGGANGFRYLTLRLPLLWPLAPVMNFPGLMPLWAWLYRQIAIRRYRWNKHSECSEACEVHFKKK
jgi:predicted DCC family thiol-disulfide oxidoreductase YuxK